MLLAHRPFRTMSPEDQRTKKQWARYVTGFYAVIAIGLFCLAFAAPSSEPQSAVAQLSRLQATVQH
jgi:hypothetical protein